MCDYLNQARKIYEPGDFRRINKNALEKAIKLKTAEAELIRAIQEVDKSKTYRYLGFNSLRQYCLKALDLTEWQTGAFIKAVCPLQSYGGSIQVIENDGLKAVYVPSHGDINYSNSFDASIESEIHRGQCKLTVNRVNGEKFIFKINNRDVKIDKIEFHEGVEAESSNWANIIQLVYSESHDKDVNIGGESQCYLSEEIIQNYCDQLQQSDAGGNNIGIVEKAAS